MPTPFKTNAQLQRPIVCYCFCFVLLFPNPCQHDSTHSLSRSHLRLEPEMSLVHVFGLWRLERRLEEPNKTQEVQAGTTKEGLSSHQGPFEVTMPIRKSTVPPSSKISFASIQRLLKDCCEQVVDYKKALRPVTPGWAVWRLLNK